MRYKVELYLVTCLIFVTITSTICFCDSTPLQHSYSYLQSIIVQLLSGATNTRVKEKSSIYSTMWADMRLFKGFLVNELIRNETAEMKPQLPYTTLYYGLHYMCVHALVCDYTIFCIVDSTLIPVRTWLHSTTLHPIPTTPTVILQ